MTVRSGGIRRDALVSSSMAGSDAVDAQEADPLISQDINVLPARVYRVVVERPRQIDREVAFHDRARNRQHLPRVERIVAERELEDLWRDCAKDRAKAKNCHKFVEERVLLSQPPIAKGKEKEEGERMESTRWRSRVPFTVSREECVVAPARFDAEHVYSPACLAATDSMVSTLFFLLVLPTTTSDPWWWLSIGAPLNAQDISSG